MPLDIASATNNLHHSFAHDDPEYWYLYPFFESLWEKTGLMIDLYDRTEFQGSYLLELFLTLEGAEKAVQVQPDSWEVAVTTDPIPQLREVKKKKLLLTIDKLKQMANDSYNQGVSLVCLGD